MLRQEVFFGCRTDGKYNDKTNTWTGLGSLLVMGFLDLPMPGYSVKKEKKRMALGKKADPN